MQSNDIAYNVDGLMIMECDPDKIFQKERKKQHFFVNKQC